MARDGALNELCVVEWGNGVPAAHCARLVSDFGAEVIKAEAPGRGDETRRYGPFVGDRPDPETSGLFMSLNLNKLGVTLEPALPSGRDLLLDLLRDADVFVHNAPPKLMEQLHLTYADLEAVNPRLVVTAITPFGQTGPYRDYRGYHLTCCAAGNIAIGTGSADREPLTLPLSLGGYQSGSAAFAATMAALLSRDRSGHGQLVDVAENEVLATLFSTAITTYAYRGVTGIRNGNRGGFLYPDVFLPCKDGHVGLVCNQLQQWIRFLELMGMPEWTQNPRYRDRRKMTEEYPNEVDALLEPWMMQHTREELFAMSREKHIPLAPAYDARELLESEHLAERAAFETVETDAGPLRFPAPPYKMSATQPHLRTRAPRLGEHNVDIFSGRLGRTGEQLGRLASAGAI